MLRIQILSMSFIQQPLDGWDLKMLIMPSKPRAWYTCYKVLFSWWIPGTDADDSPTLRPALGGSWVLHTPCLPSIFIGIHNYRTGNCKTRLLLGNGAWWRDTPGFGCLWVWTGDSHILFWAQPHSTLLHQPSPITWTLPVLISFPFPLVWRRR